MSMTHATEAELFGREHRDTETARETSLLPYSRLRGDSILIEIKLWDMVTKLTPGIHSGENGWHSVEVRAEDRRRCRFQTRAWLMIA